MCIIPLQIWKKIVMETNFKHGTVNLKKQRMEDFSNTMRNFYIY